MDQDSWYLCIIAPTGALGGIAPGSKSGCQPGDNIDSISWLHTYLTISLIKYFRIPCWKKLRPNSYCWPFLDEGNTTRLTGLAMEILWARTSYERSFMVTEKSWLSKASTLVDEAIRTPSEKNMLHTLHKNILHTYITQNRTYSTIVIVAVIVVMVVIVDSLKITVLKKTRMKLVNRFITGVWESNFGCVGISY